MLDPYDAVRYIAHRSLSRIEGYEDIEYDFVGPEERRDAIANEVLQRWEANRATRSRKERRLLIDSNGSIDARAWTQIFQARDNRPVNLEE